MAFLKKIGIYFINLRLFFKNNDTFFEHVKIFENFLTCIIFFEHAEQMFACMKVMLMLILDLCSIR